MSGEGIEFASESLEHFRANGFEELFERHWREVAHYQDIPLDPDWHSYEVLERANVLRILTARVAGELVGYVLFLVMHSPYSRSWREARQDILFIAPEFRRNGLGTRMLEFAEDRLRTDGAQVVYQHSKVKSSANIEPFLEELVYELVDTLWAKRLGRRTLNG